MKTPKVLYHSSPVNNLETIKPFNKTVRNKKEGPLVFATPDYLYAMQFLIPTDDSWVDIGIVDQTHYMVVSDEKRFIDLDKGGTIYHLLPNGFSSDTTTSMEEKEWVSKVEVKVIKKDYFSKSLPVMIEKGIKIYFVDKGNFEKMKNSLDGGYKFIRNLISNRASKL